LIVKNHWFVAIAIVLAAFFSFAFVQAASVRNALPDGWIRSGSAPQQYDVTVNDSATSAQRIVQLKSRVDASDEKFGTLMQQFRADEFREKAVRFSAELRTDAVKEWAGLWARVDDASGRILAFDNMEERAIKGSTDWTRAEIVLPVASHASIISIGVLISGKGGVAMRDVDVRAVAKETPTTTTSTQARPVPTQPVNLDFKR
jgi:hypothetical protein